MCRRGSRVSTEAFVQTHFYFSSMHTGCSSSPTRTMAQGDKGHSLQFPYSYLAESEQLLVSYHLQSTQSMLNTILFVFLLIWFLHSSVFSPKKNQVAACLSSRYAFSMLLQTLLKIPRLTVLTLLLQSHHSSLLTIR